MSTPAQAEQEVFSSDEEDQECIELKEKIEIKPSEMLHLINDKEKFTNIIIDFTNLAKTKIELNQKQQLKFALVYLKEAEKILQYAANSGKNITKEIIIAVLHNQASIYQKLWELSNCSDYLEGIIFNYENFIRQTSTQGSTISKQPNAHDPIKIKMKQKLVRYNLQFCAVSSQLSNHDAAIQAVSKAHSLMGQCLVGSAQEFKRQWSRQRQDLEHIHLRMDLLVGLSTYDKKIEQKAENLQLNKNILKAAHFSLQLWQEGKKKWGEIGSIAENEYLQYLNNYSIGNIVQIVALQFDKGEVGFMSMREKGSREFDREFHTYNKLILLSACFFSRATQLRLKSLQLFKKNPQQRKLSKQYKLSINYHLLSIMIVATFIPTNLKYLNEILMSYQKHYGVNLMEYKTVQVQSITKMMEILGIEIVDYHCSVKNTEKAELELDSKNDYNMKINFETHRGKKLDKMKSLKKITKELTDPNKRYQIKEQKSNNKSKESKTSFSISKYEKKDRTVSRNQTIKKSRQCKERQSKDKNLISHKIIPRIKSKKSNDMMKSRQRQEKKSRPKQIVDQTEQLFFCFTKKTKKSHTGTSTSQLRSTSINSNSGKSKNGKKSSILSPRTMKVKVTSPGANKPGKSPKRKNLGEQHYYL